MSTKHISEAYRQMQLKEAVKFNFQVGDEAIYYGGGFNGSFYGESCEISSRKAGGTRDNPIPLYTIITGYNGSRNNSISNVREESLEKIE